jgi:hypothetical protein
MSESSEETIYVKNKAAFISLYTGSEGWKLRGSVFWRHSDVDPDKVEIKLAIPGNKETETDILNLPN